VLTQIYGKKFSFTTNSIGLAGVERSYKSFNAAADEAGMSRIYVVENFLTQA
jgi:hypothetical protein